MTITRFEFVDKGDRIMTKVEGGVCLKPAPSDGVLLYPDDALAPQFMSQEALIRLVEQMPYDPRLDYE